MRNNIIFEIEVNSPAEHLPLFMEIESDLNNTQSQHKTI